MWATFDFNIWSHWPLVSFLRQNSFIESVPVGELERTGGTRKPSLLVFFKVVQVQHFDEVATPTAGNDDYFLNLVVMSVVPKAAGSASPRAICFLGLNQTGE